MGFGENKNCLLEWRGEVEIFVIQQTTLLRHFQHYIFTKIQQENPPHRDCAAQLQIFHATLCGAAAALISPRH